MVVKSCRDLKTIQEGEQYPQKSVRSAAPTPPTPWANLISNDTTHHLFFVARQYDRVYRVVYVCPVWCSDLLITQYFMTIKGSVLFSAPYPLAVTPNACRWLWTEIWSESALRLKPSYLAGGNVRTAAEDVQLLEDHQRPRKRWLLLFLKSPSMWILQSEHGKKRWLKYVYCVFPMSWANPIDHLHKYKGFKRSEWTTTRFYHFWGIDAAFCDACREQMLSTYHKKKKKNLPHATTFHKIEFQKNKLPTLQIMTDAYRKAQVTCLNQVIRWIDIIQKR